MYPPTCFIMQDLYQIKPVGCSALYTAALDRSNCRIRCSRPVPPHDVAGIDLFLDFKRINLSIDKRAIDPQHAEVVKAMRIIAGLGVKGGIGPITTKITDYLKARILTHLDYQEDPEWLNAPIIVTSNRERGVINQEQAVRWGRMHGVPVIRWRYPFDLALEKHIGDNTVKAWLYKYEPDLTGIFVQGAHGYLTMNVNPCVGVSNGSQVVFHSLSFSPQEDPALVEEVVRMIRAASPGEIVNIPIRPVSVNVRLPISPESEDFERWPVAANISTKPQEEVVIPVVIRRGDSTEFASTIPGIGKVKGTVKRHKVDPGFSVTFHKIQGRTLSKVIVDLNFRKHKPQIDFTMAYVGISRVRRAQDLRCLRPQKEVVIHDGVNKGRYQFPAFLTGLKPHVDLLVWEQAYGADGYFVDQSACAYLHYLERMELYKPPNLKPRKEDKIYSHKRLLASITAPTSLGRSVRQRDRGVVLPAPGETPTEEGAWMYLSLLWEVMGLPFCPRTRDRIRGWYDRTYGHGAWTAAIDNYREHLQVIEMTDPIQWQEYPLQCLPFELERVVNPMCPRLFPSDYHGGLLYQEHVRKEVPGLVVAWAQIVWFVNRYSGSLGLDWQNERDRMDDPSNMVVQV